MKVLSQSSKEEKKKKILRNNIISSFFTKGRTELVDVIPSTTTSSFDHCDFEEIIEEAPLLRRTSSQTFTTAESNSSIESYISYNDDDDDDDDDVTNDIPCQIAVEVHTTAALEGFDQRIDDNNDEDDLTDSCCCTEENDDDETYLSPVKSNVHSTTTRMQLLKEAEVVMQKYCMAQHIENFKAESDKLLSELRRLLWKEEHWYHYSNDDINTDLKFFHNIKKRFVIVVFYLLTILSAPTLYLLAMLRFPRTLLRSNEGPSDSTATSLVVVTKTPPPAIAFAHAKLFKRSISSFNIQECYYETDDDDDMSLDDNTNKNKQTR